MATEAEIREQMAQFKIDNPDVDWTEYEVYAIVNQDTQQVERMSYAKRDRIMQITGTPEVNR